MVQHSQQEAAMVAAVLLLQLVLVCYSARDGVQNASYSCSFAS
jgi:hypothetical protein